MESKSQRKGESGCSETDKESRGEGVGDARGIGLKRELKFEEDKERKEEIERDTER